MPDLLGWLDGIRELSRDGGAFVLWIFSAGVILWALIFERYWFFKRKLPVLVKEMQEQWYARPEHNSWCSRQIRTAMISRLNVAMTAGFPVTVTSTPSVTDWATAVTCFAPAESAALGYQTVAYPSARMLTR